MAADAPAKKSPEVYAHRGARSLYPEHTAAGYEAMLKIGADWSDMDVALTKDGELVITHDLALNPDVARGPDGKFLAPSQEAVWKLPLAERTEYLRKHAVNHLTMEELRKYDIGRINPQSLYAKLFPNQMAVDGSRFLTLRETIRALEKATAGKMRYQIEMKTAPAFPSISPDPERFAEKLAHLLEEEGVVDRSEVQSFDFACLAAIQRKNPKIRTAYLTSLEDMPRDLEKHGGSIPRLVRALGGFAWEPEDRQITKAALDEAHALGLKVVVWSWPEKTGTDFDPETIEKLIAWGVDGIITDDPARMNAMLSARGLPTPKKFGCERLFAE